MPRSAGGIDAARAIELLHDADRSDGRTWPQESLPVSFLRVPWREAVLGATSTLAALSVAFGKPATLPALRDRLRAGDI